VRPQQEHADVPDRHDDEHERLPGVLVSVVGLHLSLSTDTEYLAKRGIRAQGGPRDGQILDDGSILWRTIKQDGGFYHLRGKADGGFIYVWADLAPLDPR
jgi:hypothetical protein